MAASSIGKLRRKGLPRSRRYIRVSNPLFGALIALPALIVLAFVILAPLARTMLLSFQHAVLVEPPGSSFWIGMKNYRLVGGNPELRIAVLNTVVFTGFCVIGQFIIGFGLALLLNQDLKARNLLRGLFLLPWVVPTIVTMLVWMYLFNASYGVINFLLKKVHLIDQFRSWATSPSLAMPLVITLSIWKGFPFHMVMLLAGLQTVPLELIDAAKVDGAGALGRFRHVSLPWLRHVITVLLLVSMIWTVQHFATIWLLTGGGPGDRTTTIAVLMYRTAFLDWNMGKAASAGVLWLLAIFIVSLIGIRLGLRRSET